LFDHKRPIVYVGCCGLSGIWASLPDPTIRAISRAPSPPQVVVMDKNAWYEAELDKGVWLVEFHKPTCSTCQKLVQEWKKAAEALKGVVRVGAIDCADESMEGVCDRLGVKGFPAIKWLRRGVIGGPYKGKKKAADIVTWGKSILPNNVELLATEAEMDAALGRCMGSGKDRAAWSMCLLLFTDKTDTPPMFKSLALQYEGDVVFGEVRGDNATRQAPRFVPEGALPDFPFLVAVCNGDPGSARRHTGAPKHDAIKKFIEEYR